MSPTIPVIDVGQFLSASEIDRARVVRQVRDALEEVGFLTISGHGVPESLIDRVSQASLAFFDRPDEEKARYSIPGHPSRGFGAMRSRTVGITQNPTLKKSLQEGFGVGPMRAPGDGSYRTDEGGGFVENVWPDEPADFEPAVREYYGHMQRLFRLIMSMFAVALELPQDYFDPKLTHGAPALRLTHYPALDEEPEPGEERAGAHTDTGILTILHIDDTPNSLQVETRSEREWINVNRVPGTFVINIGDLMMRWTNDKWVSNTHRVVNPPFINGHSARRLSIVSFCSVNADTLIESLPNCSGPGNPARYAPIRAGEYQAARAATRYGLKPPVAS
jgi:isopenicillin N synthase-like dioxygenase